MIISLLKREPALRNTVKIKSKNVSFESPTFTFTFEFTWPKCEFTNAVTDKIKSLPFIMKYGSFSVLYVTGSNLIDMLQRVLFCNLDPNYAVTSLIIRLKLAETFEYTCSPFHQCLDQVNSAIH